MKSTQITSLFFALALATAQFQVALADDHDHEHHEFVKHQEWKKGYHMRNEDWSRGARVDYHEHHLRAPPHGYEWREVDGNYVLAAVATGVIASVVAASIAGH